MVFLQDMSKSNEFVYPGKIHEITTVKAKETQKAK